MTDCQKRLFMAQKKTDTIEVAAARAGFSRATGYRLAATLLNPGEETAGPTPSGPSGRHPRHGRRVDSPGQPAQGDRSG